MGYRSCCSILFAMSLALASTAKAEGYLGGSLGLALFSNGGPQEYLTHNDAGISRSSGGVNPFFGNLLAGVWLGNRFGIELGGRFGPFASGNGTVTYALSQSASYQERLDFMTLFLGPMTRFTLVENRLILVCGIQLGGQFASAQVTDTDYSSNNWSLLFGFSSRFEFEVTERTFGFISWGYEYSNMAKFGYSYPKDLFGGGSRRSYENLGPGLNKNNGVDLSGIRLGIGYGFRWGLSRN